MATKKAKKVTTLSQLRASNKETADVIQKFETLKATVREYFSHIRYRSPEYSIKLAATIAGENGAQKVHMANVSSLIASVVTAQGLGKEVRVKAIQDPTGGALVLDFYSPVNIDGKINLLS
jgi:ABC-type proline/glycine betaine transport system permease subunit